MTQTFVYEDDKLRYLKEQFYIYASDEDVTFLINEYNKLKYDRLALHFSKQALQYLKSVNLRWSTCSESIQYKCDNQENN